MITSTLLVLIGFCVGLAYLTDTKFIDFSFFIGLIATVIIWFFTSKGGVSSGYVDTMIQKDATNFKMKSDEYKFKPNIIFLTSLTYTIVSFIAMLIHYRSYF